MTSIRIQLLPVRLIKPDSTVYLLFFRGKFFFVLTMSDSDDQKKCQQMVFSTETIEKNTPLAKIGNNVNIVYESPFNNFKLILDDVVALSNSGGGSIWIPCRHRGQERDVRKTSKNWGPG